MRFLRTVAMAVLAFSSNATLAQAKSIAIPSISFVGHGISYNRNGTAAFIRERAFAPVYLPDGVRVTGFRCGARVTRVEEGITIKLRRNHPQQANIDMGMVEIPRLQDGEFKFLANNSVVASTIDNRRFNYYLIVEAIPKSAVTAGTCNVNGGPNACFITACNVDFLPLSAATVVR